MLNTFNQDDIGDAHLHYCIFSCRNNESERIVTPISEGTLFGDNYWILRCSGGYALQISIVQSLFEVLTLCWSMWYCV